MVFRLEGVKPQVGFEFDFIVEHEGNSYHHLCRVTDVILEKKIAYTWRVQLRARRFVGDI
jgi:hypothetical protein